MAEGAHLTSAFENGKPSIFEVLAQESLLAAVRPAIKHAVRVLAESRPERFAWLLRYYDEVYTVLDLLLEQYHLRKYSATYAEHFYSLRRQTLDQNVGPLPRRVIWKSVLFVVLLPYIKQKLDDMFEHLRHSYNTRAASQGMSKLSRAFVAVYPYIHTTWEGSVLMYQTAYMFGKSDWHSPFLRLTGVTLVNDIEIEETSSTSSSLPWNNLRLYEKLIFLMKKILNITAVTLTTGMSVGLFFIQFLDWWYSSDTSHASLTVLPVPDPPQKDDTLEARQFNVCPLCHKTRSNDTVLAVSGYVFCYPCIYDYVKEYKQCPVTKYPAKTDHLIKLYISGS